jgi:hypothetical protein
MSSVVLFYLDIRPGKVLDFYILGLPGGYSTKRLRNALRLKSGLDTHRTPWLCIMG